MSVPTRLGLLKLLVVGAVMAGQLCLLHAKQPAVCGIDRTYPRALWHHQPDCVAPIFSRPSSAPYSSPTRSGTKGSDGVQPYTSWLPNAARAVHVQSGYWYVALGLGATNYVSNTVLKIDSSSLQSIANVTLHSSYEIITILGNATHLFVGAYDGDTYEMLILTLDGSTLEQVYSVAVDASLLPSGVNTAGTLFVVSKLYSNYSSLLRASDGQEIAALNGGDTDLVLYAAALDVTTDTAIVADDKSDSIRGISFNNTELWSIALPKDQDGVVSLAVNGNGRALYVFMLITTADADFPGLRFSQYDLNTRKEVARFDNLDWSLVPTAILAAGEADGQVYMANTVDGTLTRLTLKDGTTMVHSLSRYPFLQLWEGLASLNGSSIAAFTIDPFTLWDISRNGFVLRRTQVASAEACDQLSANLMNIDIDMHGNVFVPLCSLGVRVYSPSHELLHIIQTPSKSRPVDVAVTLSGEYVYVIYDTWLPVQLWEVATSKLVANISVPDDGLDAIAVDISDDSLWGIGAHYIYHWARNTTLLGYLNVSMFAREMAVDSQHRRLVISVVDDGGFDERLCWYDMVSGKRVQNFTYLSTYAASAVAVTKDGAISLAVERISSVLHFFPNNDSRAGEDYERWQVDATITAE